MSIQNSSNLYQKQRSDSPNIDIDGRIQNKCNIKTGNLEDNLNLVITKQLGIV